MQMNEVRFHGALAIDGYGPGFFRVGGVVREGAVLVRPESVIPWGGYGDVATLRDLAGEVDVLFIGTGAEIGPLPAGLRAELEDAGLGVEMMASAAACRSYNVLLSEGRRVAAALHPVDGGPDAG